MKRMTALFLTALLFITISACGGRGEPEHMETPSPSPEPTLEPTPTPIPTPIPTPVQTDESEAVGEPLSKEELEQLSYDFSYPFEPGSRTELISFLTCAYSKPTEVDPFSVFHVGMVGFDRVTDEEMDFLAEKGGYAIPTDWREQFRDDGTPRYGRQEYLLRVSTMDDILMRRLGVTYSELEREFAEHAFKNYWVPEYEAFYEPGYDSDTWTVEFLSGQYMGDDVYVLDYYANWLGELNGENCRVTFTMKENDPDTIMFLSNVVIDGQSDGQE